MRIPMKPPDRAAFMERMANENPARLSNLLFNRSIKPDPKGKYYHWDKLRHLPPPDDLTTEEWWHLIKTSRNVITRCIPHTDKKGKNLIYCEPDIVRRMLHQIDIHGGGELKATEQVANPRSREMYLVNSLIEEAITSSQLEGAATTRKVAKAMLREKRKPRDRSEKMIVNNYRAMQFIKDIAQEDLSPPLIYELHTLLTVDTLDNPGAVGQLRQSNDIYVGDGRDATILHEPPRYEELPARIENLCRFANDTTDTEFIHPVVKAILLHFILAYDHPFEDGNGRTARALFYWSMMKQNYWTVEFISISRILKKAFAPYMRAYLYTETDDNDVTYFVVHQLGVIQRAIEELFVYLRAKSEEMKITSQLLSRSPELQELLNHRQIALLSRALKKPDSHYSVESHRGAHTVTYDTARTDLLKLEKLGLVVKSKVGNAFIFSPVANLRYKLEGLILPP